MHDLHNFKSITQQNITTGNIFLFAYQKKIDKGREGVSCICVPVCFLTNKGKCIFFMFQFQIH